MPGTRWSASTTCRQDPNANLDGIAMRFVEGSILDPDALADAAAGADAVVHLAARPSVPRSIADPVASHEANATGTIAVLEAARAHDDPHRRSSRRRRRCTAPTRPARSTRTCDAAPLSPYAASKLATEAYTLAWQHSYGLRDAGVPVLQRVRPAASRRATPTPR